MGATGAQEANLSTCVFLEWCALLVGGAKALSEVRLELVARTTLAMFDRFDWLGGLRARASHMGLSLAMIASVACGPVGAARWVEIARSWLGAFAAVYFHCCARVVKWSASFSLSVLAP